MIVGLFQANCGASVGKGGSPRVNWQRLRPNAQIAVDRRRRGEQVKSTHCRPSFERVSSTLRTATVNLGPAARNGVATQGLLRNQELSLTEAMSLLASVQAYRQICYRVSRYMN